MFELVRVVIALVGSAAAGLWDLKTSDIPDWVCILMAVAGLSLFGAEGYLTADWSGLTTSLAVGGAFALFGLGMWLAGQWGGGDGELLAAIGVLLPAWPAAARSAFPLPLALLINVFFVGVVYTVAYAAVLAYIKPGLSAVIGRRVKADSQLTVPLTLGAVAAVAVLWLLTGAAWLFVFPALVIGIPILYRALKAVESSFYIRLPARRLKPGDMLGEDIPRLNLAKRRIRGLTAAEVKKIKQLKKFVTIREGVRFGPVFVLALAVTLAVGDLVTYILLQLM